VVVETTNVILNEEGTVTEKCPINFGRLVVDNDGGC